MAGQLRRLSRIVEATILFSMMTVPVAEAGLVKDCVQCAPLSQGQLQRAIASIQDARGLSLEIYYYDPPELPFRRSNGSVEAGARCLISRGEYVNDAAELIDQLAFASVSKDGIEPVAEFRFLRSGRTVLTALFPNVTTHDSTGPAVPSLVNGRMALFHAAPVKALIKMARDKTSAPNANVVCDGGFKPGPSLP